MPWLTPSEEAGTVYRTLAIPVPFLTQVSGALLDLELLHNWEEYGDMTPEECVDAMSDMINEYYGTSIMIGMVMPWAGDEDDIPDRLLLCDGSVYNTVDYPMLYSVLAPAYKINADTFRVPDLVDMFVRGTDENTGATGGEDAHTLTVDEIPAHDHTIPGSSCFPYGEIPEVCVAGSIIPQNTGSTGGGNAHNNIPAYHALTYVIVAK
jgi:microcystin-dependent protein